MLLKGELGLLYRSGGVDAVGLPDIHSVSWFLNLFGAVTFSTSQSPLLLKWPGDTV